MQAGVYNKPACLYFIISKLIQKGTILFSIPWFCCWTSYKIIIKIVKLVYFSKRQTPDRGFSGSFSEPLDWFRCLAEVGALSGMSSATVLDWLLLESCSGVPLNIQHHCAIEGVLMIHKYILFKLALHFHQLWLYFGCMVHEYMYIRDARGYRNYSKFSDTLCFRTPPIFHRNN